MSVKSYKAVMDVLYQEKFNANELLLEVAKIAPGAVVKAAKAIRARANPPSISYPATNESIGRIKDVLGDYVKDVSSFLSRGEKIQAIKLIREKTGLGLKEAKDIVDCWH